jgi:hypothetical protein
MADDWIKECVDIYKRQQQEQQDAQRRADVAAVRAPSVFGPFLESNKG